MSARALLKLDFSERLAGRLQGKKSDSWPRHKVALAARILSDLSRDQPAAYSQINKYIGYFRRSGRAAIIKKHLSLHWEKATTSSIKFAAQERHAEIFTKVQFFVVQLTPQFS
jgi:hypothetical protein